MVIDIQENLFPFIEDHDLLKKNCNKLLKGLKLLKSPFLVCEQYSKGLGKTLPSLLDLISPTKIYEKNSFSACDNSMIMDKITSLHKPMAVLIGTEAHVCVLQTCLDLIKNNIQPILVVDCIASRYKYEKEIAIQRMLQNGVILTTCESLLFELCASSEHQNFKEILQLIK